GNCAKIVEHQFYDGSCGELAHHNSLTLLTETDWRRLVFEITRCAPLMGDRRSLGDLVHSPLGFGEIDGAGCIVGKADVVRVISNRRGWNDVLQCGCSHDTNLALPK